jgi:SAM-dependent methyltransferase
LNTTAENLAARWRLFMPPARPSAGLVAVYEGEAAKTHPHSLWGLLGCTPEIRSLAGKYRREIVCIDQNPHMYSAMTSLCRPSAKETFICADWLEVQPPRPFDIIFADGSITMLPLDRHPQLLQKISRMLKPEGLAVMRVHIDTPPRFKSPTQIISWYRESHPDLPLYTAAKIQFDLLLLNRQTHQVHPSDYRETILKLYDEGIITALELDKSLHLHVHTVLNYTPPEDFETLVSRHFTTVGIHNAGDFPGHENIPVYVLRKKS